MSAKFQSVMAVHDARSGRCGRLDKNRSKANDQLSMDRLGRQLYLTFRASREYLDRQMATIGASMPQWFVLRNVGAQPGISQRELADQLRLTGSTLSHHLDRLEGQGLLTRTRDTRDRRVLRVALTAEGKHRLAAMDAVADDADGVLRSLLSERDASHLRQLLLKLHDRLTDEGEQVAP
jgi:MarR family transcriptional regulator, transcriptional regulator for hemolysin